MNVLLVSHMYPRGENDSYGIFVRRQAEALKELGHSVRVLSPVPYVPDIVSRITGRTPSDEISTSARYGGVPVQYARHWSLPRSETLPIVAYLVRREVSEHLQLFEWADVANAHVAVPDGFASYPTAERARTPLVTTIHGADLQASLNRTLVKPLVKRTVTASDEIIVNSTKLRKILRNQGFEDCDPHVVHNGVPLDMVNEAEAATESGDATDLISVGNLVETKGHRYVLEAMAKSDEDFNYTVVGDGPLRDELRTRATQLGLAEQVTFVGEVPHEEVFDYLQKANVFVLPSYVEAFGIAYIEAMACGLPVIGCLGEGPADYITDGKTGFLVPPQDSENLATLLDKLANSPSLRSAVGRRARMVAFNRFSWNRNAESVTKVFERASTEGESDG